MPIGNISAGVSTHHAQAPLAQNGVIARSLDEVTTRAAADLIVAQAVTDLAQRTMQGEHAPALATPTREAPAPGQLADDISSLLWDADAEFVSASAKRHGLSDVHNSAKATSGTDIRNKDDQTDSEKMFALLVMLLNLITQLSHSNRESARATTELQRSQVVAAGEKGKAAAEKQFFSSIGAAVAGGAVAVGGLRQQLKGTALAAKSNQLNSVKTNQRSAEIQQGRSLGTAGVDLKRPPTRPQSFTGADGQRAEEPNTSLRIGAAEEVGINSDIRLPEVPRLQEKQAEMMLKSQNYQAKGMAMNTMVQSTQGVVNGAAAMPIAQDEYEKSMLTVAAEMAKSLQQAQDSTADNNRQAGMGVLGMLTADSQRRANDSGEVVRRA